jgi:hypothetical protein
VKTNHLFIVLSLSCLTFFSCEKKDEKNTQSLATEALNEVPSEVSETASKPDSSVSYAEMLFEETIFDFGTIKQGDVVRHTFKFKNTSDVPLKITNTQASCGCTTPSFPKEPVQPGGSGVIDVEFNSAGKSGNVTKDVNIFANTKTGTEVIKIKCVIKVPDNSMGPIKSQN